MKIINFKKKTNNIYEIELENNEKLNLYDEIILKYELLIEKRISEEKLSQILEENKEYIAYYSAINYLKRKMRSRHEIIQKLEQEDFSEKTINNVLNKLEEYKYINDELYIETYIQDQVKLSNNSGPLKIKNNLIKHNFSEPLILKYLNMIDTKIWEEKIKKIIDKRLKVNKDSSKVFKQKTTIYLLNSGFDRTTIMNSLNNINISVSEDIFKKKATKEWTKLSKKYNDKELIYKFKNSMYQKGYTSVDINSFIDSIL